MQNREICLRLFRHMRADWKLGDIARSPAMALRGSRAARWPKAAAAC
jgi:hypothetical protein